jgi:hypothetical protein
MRIQCVSLKAFPVPSEKTKKIDYEEEHLLFIHMRKIVFQ